MNSMLKKGLDSLVLSILSYSYNYHWTWRKSLWIFGTILVLVIGILGIKGLLGIIVGVVAFICGISFRFYVEEEKTRTLRLAARDRASDDIPESNSQSDDEDIDIVTRTLPDPTNLPKIPKQRQKLDMRITGSAIIDETIHEMVDFILRDYIHSWYDHISEDDEFIYELRKAILESLVTLSSRVKEVDWIPYLTTNLVDDAGSHLRLYRQALGKVKENPSCDLISTFFDLEATMEKNLCRDMVCTDDLHLNDYLQGLVESVLYCLLPHDTYNCDSVGILTQDIIVNHVCVPVIRLVTDPDFVNHCIVWLCQDFVITPEIFMTVIRTSDCKDELVAMQNFFNQQSYDLKKTMSSAQHEEISSMKQELKCINYVKKVIEQHINQLDEGKSDWIDEADNDDWQHYFLQPGLKPQSLTLEEVLKNSVALSYFLDFMSSEGVNGGPYLLLYLNADAWRVSAEFQLEKIESINKNPQPGKDETRNTQDMLDCMKDAAFNVYEQYLSDKASPRVKLPENIVRKFHIQLRTETVTAGLFDQIQEALLETIQTTEKFFPTFTRNKLYIKCLMELDLLKAETVSAHSHSSNSDDDEDEIEDDIVLVEGDMNAHDGLEKLTGDSVPLSEVQTCRACLKFQKQEMGMKGDELLSWEQSIWERKYKLQAEIIEVALTVEKGNTFGIYVIQAKRISLSRTGTGSLEEKEWHIYRRYSDFYDFHHWIKSKWMRLSKLDFPSKQTFGKTDRTFLERRMQALNKYLASILIMTGEPCFGESLQDSLLHFLEPGNYAPRRKQFSDKIDSLVNMTVNPLKQSVKTMTHAVKTMPDTFINTVDGFTKIFQSKIPVTDFAESLKVGSGIDAEVDDNIPLRIILLLMDEVFDLKSRNQWLRRRIVVIIRQVIKAMMGDNLNRRILDYVAYLTTPVRVSGYLKSLQDALWPGGRKLTPGASKSDDMKNKTRIAAKGSLFSSVPDELKHVIGSETTRRGISCVFDLLQNQVLNQRFLLVLIEGILKTLYPDKPFGKLIQRLHFRSNRVGKNRPFLLPDSRSGSNSSNASINSAIASSLKSSVSISSTLSSLSPRLLRKRK